MTEILLIRHGQSANNAAAEHLRTCDPPLTPLGQQQSQATAKWLSSLGVTHIYCSPFLRSLETARPIAESIGLWPMVRPDLFEQGGCYSGHELGKKRGEPGMSRAELEERYPNWFIDISIHEQGWWFGRQFETDEEVGSRADRVVEWLRSDVVGIAGRHALIIHADFKRRLLERMLPKCAAGRSMMDSVGSLHNTGVTRLSYEGPGWLVGSLNSTSHLPGEWIT